MFFDSFSLSINSLDHLKSLVIFTQYLCIMLTRRTSNLRMLSYLPWLWLFSFDYLRYNYYKCMVTFTHYFFAKTIMLINRRGNIYVAYDITKLNVYTKGKRTRYKISSNIWITNVHSCNALIFLWLKQNWIHDGKFGIPYPPHCCACPKQGPGFQSRDLFYVKGVKVKVIIRFAEIVEIADHHILLLNLFFSM